VLVERLERALEGVGACFEIHGDGAVLELCREGLGIKVASTLGQEVHRHQGAALLAGRVEGGAAAEGELDRYHGQHRLAHQPGLDAARARHALDLHRRGLRHERDGQEQRQDQALQQSHVLLPISWPAWAAAGRSPSAPARGWRAPRH
jgi:hypothetical protein